MLQELDLKRLKIPADLSKSILLVASYAAWILIFRLLCLSFLVYFLTRAGRTATFEEINEAFANNEIPFIGLASGIFLLFLRGVAPLIDREGVLSLSLKNLRTKYLPGFLQGAFLASGVVAAFLLTGSFRFVGFFVQIEDAPLAILGIALKIFALLAAGLCEEFLFRGQALAIPRRVSSILTLAVIYSVVKLAQFDLGWMHFATLFLLSISLSVRRLNEGNFLNGAGFWSAILIVFHPLLSLPVFGSDFSGIIMLKYQTQHTVPTLLSGGQGGPLASVAFQGILLIEIVRGLITYKKSLLKPSSSQ